MSTLMKVFAAAVAGVVLVVGLAFAQGSGAKQRSSAGGLTEDVHSPEHEGEVALDTSKALEAKGKEGKWFTSLPEALAAAQQTKTFILVDAYADWCGWCKKMEKDTFSDSDVRARMQKFTLLKIDTDKQSDVAQRYGVTGLPTTLLLNAKGELVLTQAGYMPPKVYLEFLARAEKAAG